MKYHWLHHILNSFAFFYIASSGRSTVWGFCNFDTSSCSECHHSRRSHCSKVSMHSIPVPCSIHEFTRCATKSNILAIATLGTILLNSNRAVASDVRSIHILLSDELEVKIDGAYLGIGLTELEYGDKKNTRVCVQSVKDNADAKVIEMVKPGMILVAVDGDNVEGQSRSQVRTLSTIAKLYRSVTDCREMWLSLLILSLQRDRSGN